MIAKGTPFVASYSGGKDSTLALWRAVRAGGKPLALLTMLDETGGRSRSHGILPAVLDAQAAALGLPRISGQASWGDYERVFVEQLGRARAMGAVAAVFGDIDLAAHRQWEEQVCAQASLAPVLPLWGEDRLALVREFVDAGFAARIVVIRRDLMADDYLGRVLDHALIERMLADGIDPCGEAGEFHTLVTGGPLFAKPLALADGDVRADGDYLSLDFGLAASI
ncbi:diphthine--ammonia ligase [Crenobacter caeni]|uniref:Diphthine--ammonia ligase n=1 Tax=Crenobacter caeni TaxID=2705474 RepID=A0A6B2KQC8_9NEIS|nr:diphthine--ammonia ligase [Crenobacter caeni]